ncbi:MAG: hypothetical protein NTY35_02085 [Planctomycetota bacterium]|nr:hypothetical protein [Planctomycetota bacterium]
MVASLSILCLAFLPQSSAPSLTIGASQSVDFPVGSGVLELQDLTVEAGARLRLSGDCGAQLRIKGTMRIDGVLDVSGTGFESGFGVSTFNTTNLQEPGRAGGPGGSHGGIGNRVNFASSAIGGSAGCTGGGAGGESAYAPLPGSQRRPGGGGGGAFGPDLPLVNPDPFSPANNGRAARPGLDGASSALGALSQLPIARGGARGAAVFVDSSPFNDFWGRKFDPITSQIVIGELLAPRAGSGGGAGGNSIQSNTFPNPSWTPFGDDKGAGGAGGGGLLIVTAQIVRIGASGRITADGGRGGSGENTNGLDCIGGGSGGGSGGMVILQARRIDLSQASDGCLSALGGDGGRGAAFVATGQGAGGDGGPGLIQLQVSNGLADVLLPPGKTLADLSVPEAHVLLPDLNL